MRKADRSGVPTGGTTRFSVPDEATTETVPETPKPAAVAESPAPAAARSGKAPARGAPLQDLLDDPSRFGFDAAVAVLMRAAATADPGAAIRFGAVSGLGFPSAEIAAVTRTERGFDARIGLLGLTGPSGVLPRPYTETVNAAQRGRLPGLPALLDLLAQRPIAQAASSGIKYRPHRLAAMPAGSGAGPAGSDGLRKALMALAGYGTPHLAPRLAMGTEPVLFYAGLFAAQPRSADRLEGMLADWLGQPVAVEQFAGAWLRLDADQRSCLPLGRGPGRFNQLGVDAAIGGRSWDPHARIRLRIGPLSWDGFRALLPHGGLLRRLAGLVRAFLGPEAGFEVNPVLAAAAIPPLRLGRADPPRLGWDSWLPTATPRRRDGTELRFGDDTIATLEDV